MSAEFWDRTDDGEWACPACGDCVPKGEGGCDDYTEPWWDFCPTCGQEMAHGKVTKDDPDDAVRRTLKLLRLKPLPGNLTVMPNVHTWLRPWCGMTAEGQARKVVEEALELHEATVCLGRVYVEDEWADCLMALANMAALLSIDMDEAVRRCEIRQQERGRYE